MEDVFNIFFIKIVLMLTPLNCKEKNMYYIFRLTYYKSPHYDNMCAYFSVIVLLVYIF